MAGLPVLASNFPEMQRVVDETAAGATADPADVDVIRQQITALLEDPARRAAGARASLAAARRYNWEREADKLIQLYNAL